jgi:pseudaminic acid synthase
MIQSVSIANHTIGPNKQVFIIGEIGSNHNRDYNEAIRLIDIAKASGCDAVKFQTYKADTLYSIYTPRLSEMEGRTKPAETPYEVIKRIEMPWEWHGKLADYCKQQDILFLSSPFDEEAVNVLESVNVAAYKVASYELVHLPLLRYIAQTGKPMILSTGNTGLGDIETALETIYKENNNQVILLHCVSQYPAQYSDINLRAIETLKLAFNVPIGFSDHTEDAISAIGAVALGACVLEKHITLDKSQPGPDHPFSLEPAELKEFVHAIRSVEQALGSSIKKVTVSESENHKLARRSIHAAIDLKAGDILTEEKICIKRPALGIKPQFLPMVVGKPVRKNIKQDQWISWDMI